MCDDTRQMVMFLETLRTDLWSSVVGWSTFDPTVAWEDRDQTGSSDEPPYGSVMEALRDGWRLLQMVVDRHRDRSTTYERGPLPFEFVLVREVRR